MVEVLNLWMIHAVTNPLLTSLFSGLPFRLSSCSISLGLPGRSTGIASAAAACALVEASLLANSCHLHPESNLTCCRLISPRLPNKISSLPG